MSIDPNLPHYEIRKFISAAKPGYFFDKKFCKITGFPPGSYSTKLQPLLEEMDRSGWWFHLSHLEARVSITKYVECSDGMLSNSESYDDSGKPVKYSYLHNNKQYAYAMCIAIVKAMYDLPDAYHVKASGKEEQNRNNELWNLHSTS